MANLPSDDKRKEKLKVEVIPTYVNKKGISGKVINNRLAKIKAHFSEYELIGTHAGRRTFICFALSSGIPPQVVMKWTGNSDYQAMKPYIDISEKTKVNAMQLFEEEMSK